MDVTTATMISKDMQFLVEGEKYGCAIVERFSVLCSMPRLFLELSSGLVGCVV